MKITPDMSILKALLTAIIGAIAGVAYLLSELMEGKRQFVAWHIFGTLIVGGFLGYMGGELSLVLSLERWQNIFAGVLAVMGGRGFDLLVKKTENKIME